MLRAIQRLFVSDEIEGYDHPALVETIFRKTLAYEPTGSWPLVSGKRTVLDFGGGCGVHYKLARRQESLIRWAVVESPAMVARAKKLETDRLRFFSDIATAAAWLGPIDLMHSDGAIQYVSNPMAAVRHLCALKAKTMFWDRVYWTNGEPESETQVSYLGDNGPGPRTAPRARVLYTRTPVPAADFLKAHCGYSAEIEGDRFTFYQGFP